MNPTSSFFGKIVTLLIGCGLSWLTLTNQEADLAAQRIFGPSEKETTELLSFSHNSVGQPSNQRTIEQSSIASVEATSTPQEKPPGSDLDQLQELSAMLKKLGASYLRVEKLVQGDECWYRVRCDLDQKEVKCCLEATRDNPVAAMREVLRAANAQT